MVVETDQSIPENVVAELKMKEDILESNISESGGGTIVMAYQAVDEIMARCEKDGVEFWKAVQLEDCEENGISEEESWNQMTYMWNSMKESVADVSTRRQFPEVDLSEEKES